MIIGDKIPVSTQRANYSDDEYPVAYIYDIDGEEIPGSPVNLEARGDEGEFVGADPVYMPDSPYVDVYIRTYVDEAHTVLSSQNGGENYRVFLTAVEASGGGVQNAAQIIAVVEPGECSDFPIQDTIIQGSDRTLVIRLIQNGLGVPYDLSGVTEIEFRFRNADGTVLSLKLSDEEDPVDILNAVAGMLSVSLTAEQTLELAPRTPAPFTIKVTKPSGIAVINVPTQVAVEEQDV